MPEFNSIQTDFMLAAGFMESCKKFPSQNALFIGEKFYSYKDLLEKTTIVFGQLNINENLSLIGIYTEESVWTYASILAISLAGACYVPLNSKLPLHKLQNIVDTFQPELIITEHLIPFSHNGKQLMIDKTAKPEKKIKTLVHQDLAYLLFTSGTTGEPKGVPISKKNCYAFFEHYKNNFDFNETDKFLQPYELSFDVSVFSIFAPWSCGACVYVVPEDGFKYLNCMNIIKTHGITVSSMVPTVLQYVEKYLNEFSFPSLRYCFFSGDKLYQHLAVKWQKTAASAEIYNCYGPTETTIVCTSYHWNESTSETESLNNIVPLGKPFENMSYILVDEKGDFANNKVGEICFNGPQVITCYFGTKHEQNFFTYNNKRYYKTGDLAEVNENGNLIFHGRKDSQVKINGFRVELAEIENAIFKLTGKNVVVISYPENNLETLYAFLESEKLEETEIKRGLMAFLPQYMIPVHFKFLNAFPNNINGKINRIELKQLTD